MDVVSILKRHGVRPSKGLGQNFLLDARIQQHIVDASELSREDVVLEIGPGVGLLTQRLAERAGWVVAVELDRKMIAILDETLRGIPHVEVLQADILKIDHVAEIARVLGVAGSEVFRFKVVANLPYYITSAALRHMLTASVRPELMTVMVQDDVARRIIASPGDMSLLAVSVQVFGEPEIVRRVPAGAFYPRPKVDSAVLRVRLEPTPKVPEEDLPLFFRVVRAGFAQKRKQLLNSLTNSLPLTRAAVQPLLGGLGIDPRRRAQTLSIQEWVVLADALKQLLVP